MSVIGAFICGVSVAAMYFVHWSPLGYAYWSAFAIVAAWETWRARKRGD